MKWVKMDVEFDLIHLIEFVYMRLKMYFNIYINS